MAELPASRLVAKFNRAASLSREDWRFLAFAVLELALARLRHGRQSASEIFRDLQTAPCQSTASPRDMMLDEADARRISWAISCAAARVPWRSDCLVQAMAAHRWLRRAGMRAEVFVGVQKNSHGALFAHAWLRRGDMTITGGAHERFHVLLGPPDQTA